MARILHCWAFPIPKDFAHATALAAELQAQQRPQNRLFERLAGWLGSQAVEPGTWAHGIVGGRSDRPVCRLAIREERAEPLMAGIVEAATSMGLVVLDDTKGECHLPGGTLLEQGGAHRIGRHLGREINGPLTPALVERTLFDLLFPLLVSEGFEESRAAGGLGRRHANGTQWLRWRSIEAPPGRVAFDLDIVLLDDAIRSFMDQALAAVFPGEKHTITAAGSLGTFASFHRLKAPGLVTHATQYFEIGTVDELKALVIGLRTLVADQLRPLLDEWRDRDSIAYNVSDRGFMAHRIVGHSTSLAGDTISSAVHGAALLHVRASGTPVVEVMLAGLAKAPVMERIVGEVRERIERLPEPRRSGEQQLLEMCLEALRATGLLDAPQSGP